MEYLAPYGQPARLLVRLAVRFAVRLEQTRVRQQYLQRVQAPFPRGILFSFKSPFQASKLPTFANHVLKSNQLNYIPSALDTPQTKFSASSMSPVPLYCATFG